MFPAAAPVVVVGVVMPGGGLVRCSPEYKVYGYTRYSAGAGGGWNTPGNSCVEHIGRDLSAPCGCRCGTRLASHYACCRHLTLATKLLADEASDDADILGGAMVEAVGVCGLEFYYDVSEHSPFVELGI